jgi:hypothetical protein
VRWLLLLLLIGCRQILGINDPHQLEPDAPSSDGPSADAIAMADGPVSDAASAWPCGATPDPLPAQFADVQNANLSRLVVSQIVLGTNGNRTAVVAPSTAVAIAFHYAITDTACTADCLDQIEFGDEPGAKKGCVFNAPVSKTAGATGDVSFTYTAPETVGQVSVVAALGQAFNCSAAFYFGTPAASKTLGYVCVH